MGFNSGFKGLISLRGNGSLPNAGNPFFARIHNLPSITTTLHPLENFVRARDHLLHNSVLNRAS